jgi:5S rRNA maturation endonuclease (ribonuclease M5)
MNKRILEDIERLEKLEEIIEELKNLAGSGAVIVVEGRKDSESLRHLGIEGDIRFATQQPLLGFTESLSKSSGGIILLTDWDRKGGIIARKIIAYLLTYGVMPNTEIRSKIRGLVKKRIKDVESLGNYIDKLRAELYGVPEF